MKLLIVEDEEALSKVMKEKFEREGMTVETVNDGGKAFEVASRFKPDFILLDIILPHKDGLEILAELKADVDLKNVPVIILSNIVDDDRMKNALKIGAVDYIMKVQHPINEIVEKVKEHALKAK